MWFQSWALPLIPFCFRIALGWQGKIQSSHPKPYGSGTANCPASSALGLLTACWYSILRELFLITLCPNATLWNVNRERVIRKTTGVFFSLADLPPAIILRWQSGSFRNGWAHGERRGCLLNTLLGIKITERLMISFLGHVKMSLGSMVIAKELYENIVLTQLKRWRVYSSLFTYHRLKRGFTLPEGMTSSCSGARAPPHINWPFAPWRDF